MHAILSLTVSVRSLVLLNVLFDGIKWQHHLNVTVKHSTSDTKGSVDSDKIFNVSKVYRDIY